MTADWTLDDARAIVTKARAEMRTENEATAERVMAWLDDAEPEVRRKFFIQYVENRRSDYAANDYAETRLSEMQAQLEKLAQEIDANRLPVNTYKVARDWLSDALREVARG